MLIELGHTITHDWTSVEKTPIHERTKEIKKEFARKDL
jgi:hypothetical protein